MFDELRQCRNKWLHLNPPPHPTASSNILVSIIILRSQQLLWTSSASKHDGIIKWRYFPRYWPFVRKIHRSPVNSPHKGQWRRALTFSLICAWTNSWVNNGETGDLRRHRAHHDVIVMGYQRYPKGCYNTDVVVTRIVSKCKHMFWKLCHM